MTVTGADSKDRITLSFVKKYARRIMKRTRVGNPDKRTKAYALIGIVFVTWLTDRRRV